MRINTAMMLQQASQTGLVQKRLSSVLEKLATGLKINSASDDAAGLAVAKQLEAMARGYKQSGDNINYGSAALNIADGATGQVSDILQRQSELATQASSDTMTSKDRQALDTEYQALNQELGRISGSTQFNGMNLLDGQSQLSNGQGNLQIGPGANSASQLQTPKMDATPTAIGAGGSIATAAGAKSALTTVSKALDNVSALRANIGASVNRLDYASQLNDTSAINTTDAQSRIEDLDYAQGAMDFARVNILNQSSMFAQKTFNQVSQNTVLGLLQ